jgi:hypothetical protein
MEHSLSTCDVCGVGNIKQEVRDSKVTHRGVTGTVVISFYACDHCNGEYANYLHAARNKAAVRDFRARVDEELGPAKE